VVRFRDHVRLFSEPTARDHLSFLLDTPRRRVPDAAPDPTATPEAALQICLERVASVGLEAVELDITTPEIAAAGLHVCKVFLPGSVPLTSTLPAVGSPRLRSVPKILGYGDEVGDHLNRVPHPFP
jgi:ribosomal protein S12 methylthiotransferase accessory factor